MEVFSAATRIGTGVAWALALPCCVGDAQVAPPIETAKRVSVSALASGYPDRPLEEWLVELTRVEPDDVSWEVNDCGEGGDGRQAPTCVEASVTRSPDTSIHVSLVVQSISAKTDQPEIWMLYATERGQVRVMQTLTDVVDYARRADSAVTGPCCFRQCAVLHPGALPFTVTPPPDGAPVMLWTHQICFDKSRDHSVSHDDPADIGRIPAGARCAFCAQPLPLIGKHAIAFDVGSFSPPHRFWSHPECLTEQLRESAIDDLSPLGPRRR